jgi:hypothetical protein
MKKEIDNELHNYLLKILDLLCEEKSSSTNNIDSLIANMANSGHEKRCLKCDMKNIENRKQTCPKCHTKLLTLTELQQQNPIELDMNLSEQPVKQTIFKYHNFENKSNVTSVPQISMTQKPMADENVNVPEIYIPDPLNINPNSIANVENILLHIEQISGVKNGIRKWIAVVCDGVPYHHAIKLKEKFPWLVLIPGQLHEEMNMLKSFVELNW